LGGYRALQSWRFAARHRHMQNETNKYDKKKTVRKRANKRGVTECKFECAHIPRN